MTTSSQRNGVLRVLDMLTTAWLRRKEYDVAQVDVYGGRSFLWAEAVSFLFSALEKRHVVVVRGGSLPELARSHPRRVTGVLNRAAAVIAPSPYLAGELNGCRRDIRTVPNPLEIGRYAFRRRAPARPRLLWLRSFHRLYRPTLAPRVLSRVLEEEPDARLTMVGPDRGDGSLEETRALARDLGVTSRLEIIGPIPKSRVPEVMQDADIFLNTSVVDNAPVTVLEAMASGLCVVSTAAGGIPDLCEDGVEALLRPVDDADALAGGVVRVLRDRELAASLSERGRSRAELHDWSRVLPEWEAVLAKVLDGAAAVGG